METDAQKISFALSLWANYIETGNVHLCSSDASQRNMKVKNLETAQMALIARLRELSSLAMQGKIKISE